MDEGFNDIGGAVSTTAKGIGSTVVNVVDNGGKVINGVFSGDGDQFSAGARGLVKTAAIGALAIGVVDFVDGADAVEGTEAADAAETEGAPADHNPPALAQAEAPSADQVTLVDNPNMHHVEPHWRTLPDGTRIWVDGDGDTSVNTTGGWNQHNPDYRTKA